MDIGQSLVEDGEFIQKLNSMNIRMAMGEIVDHYLECRFGPYAKAYHLQSGLMVSKTGISAAIRERIETCQSIEKLKLMK